MKKSLSEKLPEHIFERIYQDIGHATTCGKNCTEAVEIAEKLCEFIADELEKKK